MVITIYEDYKQTLNENDHHLGAQTHVIDDEKILLQRGKSLIRSESKKGQQENNKDATMNWISHLIRKKSSTSGGIKIPLPIPADLENQHSVANLGEFMDPLFKKMVETLGVNTIVDNVIIDGESSAKAIAEISTKMTPHAIDMISEIDASTPGFPSLIIKHRDLKDLKMPSPNTSFTKNKSRTSLYSDPKFVHVQEQNKEIELDHQPIESRIFVSPTSIISDVFNNAVNIPTQLLGTYEAETGPFQLDNHCPISPSSSELNIILADSQVALPILDISLKIEHEAGNQPLEIDNEANISPPLIVKKVTKKGRVKNKAEKTNGNEPLIPNHEY